MNNDMKIRLPQTGVSTPSSLGAYLKKIWLVLQKDLKMLAALILYGF
jgi:hypothetical protein